MGEICFFPHCIAREGFRRRKEQAEEACLQRDEQQANVKLLLGDLDALAEIQRGLSSGNWANARAYVSTETEMRLAALREILGVA